MKASFAAWLEKQLEERGMTQAELARRAGVTRGAINGILQEARGPGVELCQGIAKALDIPVQDVYEAAGLIPPDPKRDRLAERVLREMEDLPEEEKEGLIDYIRFVLKRKKR